MALSSLSGPHARKHGNRPAVIRQAFENAVVEISSLGRVLERTVTRVWHNKSKKVIGRLVMQDETDDEIW